ncbi:MAG TPA: hypothetical protein VNX67_01390 [Solirubrobacteraceae bacterium]|jgi:hypothetical protein|nr:hypothetical protein [Solirubrobacteraceae bacterium]
MGRLRAQTPLIALIACACVLLADVALAADTLAVHESFTPDKLGVPTNLSVTARFLSTTGTPPSPITKLALYAPAGLRIDARGAGTCSAAVLAQRGPGGCPANSRAGFGGGVGLVELPKSVIREPYTIDFFFGPPQHGHLTLLAYASALAPVPVELIVIAREVRAPKPYGIGFSVEIPPIATLPGASLASVESAYATFGARNVAYYETVHGKRTLVHLRGMIAPKSCPAGGFPSEGEIVFADGTTLTVNPTIPCPR